MVLTEERMQVPYKSNFLHTLWSLEGEEDKGWEQCGVSRVCPCFLAALPLRRVDLGSAPAHLALTLLWDLG